MAQRQLKSEKHIYYEQDVDGYTASVRRLLRKKRSGGGSKNEIGFI